MRKNHSFLAMIILLISFIGSISFAAVRAALQPGIYQQQIDHFGDPAGIGTFGQRFWVDSEYAKDAQAPVLLRLCGEAQAEVFLDDETPEFARQLGARIVYLEHRYYGHSQPFPDLSAEHLKFLSLNNVLEDISSFQKWLAQTQGWQGKWVVLGGSYSGTLAALYRYTHPKMAVGALASSAPMESLPGNESDDDIADLSSTDPQDYMDSGSRQWAYQSCSTFGFWMMTWAGSFIEPGGELCRRLYDIKDRANKADYNAAYYTPMMENIPGAATHILFTNGSGDGWSQLSIRPDNNKNPGVVTQIIQDGGHHYDLNPSEDSASIQQARQLFLQLAKSWLQ